MIELDDHELLAQFAREHSDTAFTALVRRHVNLVYSVAIRHTGNPHAAEEITQAVFIVLARKAGQLSPNVVLSGWLYQSARLATINHTRAETRRTRREQQTFMQSQFNEAPGDEPWRQIAPLLDDSLARLGERDRNAIVLRFFENRTFAEVGRALGSSEGAAKMRVNRALEKLRILFSRRGVTLSAAVIAAGLSADAVQAAPAGIVAVAATTTGASTNGLATATLKTMTWMKMKLAAGMSASAVLVATVTVLLIGADDERPPNAAVARQMLQALFARVSAPMPAQMRFVAEVEEVNKPWSDAQIRQEVKRQEMAEREQTANVPGLRKEDLAGSSPEAKEQRRRDQALLREIRLATVRRAHGLRTFIKQEWLAGSAWRLDSLEITEQPDILKTALPPLEPGTFYEHSLISPGAADGVQRSALINHRDRYVRVDDSNASKEKLWQAATLEPSIAFLLTFAIGDLGQTAQLAKTKPQAEKKIDSFAGTKLDPEKLEALVSGKDSRWIVTTEEVLLDDRKLAVLRLKGKAFSMARGQEVAFFADATNLTNIHRIEIISMPFTDTPCISIRDDFDQNGFPHTWIVETPKHARTVKKTVKFKEIEWNAQFDIATVFFTEIPAGYTVHR